jgi:hypothetical protein
METPETTREISNRHDDEAVSIAIVSQQIIGLKELVEQKLCFQDTQLALIKDQTTKTNGHVADAFREIAGLNAWKNKAVGMSLAVNIFVVPVLMFLLYDKLSG